MTSPTRPGLERYRTDVLSRIYPKPQEKGIRELLALRDEKEERHGKKDPCFEVVRKEESAEERRAEFERMKKKLREGKRELDSRF